MSNSVTHKNQVPDYATKIYLDKEVIGGGAGAVNFFIEGNYDIECTLFQLNGNTLMYGGYTTRYDDLDKPHDTRLDFLPDNLKTDIVSLKEEVINYLEIEDIDYMIDSIEHLMEAESKKYVDNGRGLGTKNYLSDIEPFLRTGKVNGIGGLHNLLYHLGIYKTILKSIKRKYYS